MFMLSDMENQSRCLVLKLRRSRPGRFSKRIKSVELGFVPLLDLLPAEFHRRCQAVILDRKEFVREVEPLHEFVPAGVLSVTQPQDERED